jgi:hypothetical protein
MVSNKDLAIPSPRSIMTADLHSSRQSKGESVMKFLGKLSLSLVAVFLFLSLSISASAQQFSNSSARATTLPAGSVISTLYSMDPLANTLCFNDGGEGNILQKGGVYNRCSHIEFDNYKRGALTVAVQGSEVGRIIDLGTSDDLGKQYGYQESTVANGQSFASIEAQNGKLVILKTPYKPERQDLTQAATLFEKGQITAAAEAKAGHIYLVRISDSHDKDFQILVKLLVLSVRPGESVTFRWQLL